jgi:hypothetical protein
MFNLRFVVATNIPLHDQNPMPKTGIVGHAKVIVTAIQTASGERHKALHPMLLKNHFLRVRAAMLSQKVHAPLLRFKPSDINVAAQTALLFAARRPVGRSTILWAK